MSDPPPPPDDLSAPVAGVYDTDAISPDAAAPPAPQWMATDASVPPVSAPGAIDVGACVDSHPHPHHSPPPQQQQQQQAQHSQQQQHHHQQMQQQNQHLPPSSLLPAPWNSSAPDYAAAIAAAAANAPGSASDPMPQPPHLQPGASTMLPGYPPLLPPTMMFGLPPVPQSWQSSVAPSGRPAGMPMHSVPASAPGTPQQHQHQHQYQQQQEHQLQQRMQHQFVSSPLVYPPRSHPLHLQQRLQQQHHNAMMQLYQHQQQQFSQQSQLQLAYNSHQPPPLPPQHHQLHPPYYPRHPQLGYAMQYPRDFGFEHVDDSSEYYPPWPPSHQPADETVFDPTASSMGVPQSQPAPPLPHAQTMDLAAAPTTSGGDGDDSVPQMLQTAPAAEAAEDMKRGLAEVDAWLVEYGNDPADAWEAVEQFSARMISLLYILTNRCSAVRVSEESTMRIQIHTARLVRRVQRACGIGYPFPFQPVDQIPEAVQRLHPGSSSSVSSAPSSASASQRRAAPGSRGHSHVPRQMFEATIRPQQSVQSLPPPPPMSPRETQQERGRRRKTTPGWCRLCSRVSSPEWRKGPGGLKCLCNACGLYYRKRVLDEQAAIEIIRADQARAQAAAAMVAAAEAAASGRPGPRNSM